MFSYTTASQTSYVFVTSVVTATQAERACTDIGGHLATYPSLADQAEAEQVGGCGCEGCLPAIKAPKHQVGGASGSWW
jgi:hypothetical protein